MGKIIQFPGTFKEEVEELALPNINDIDSEDVVETEGLGITVREYIKIKPIEKENKCTTKKTLKKSTTKKIINYRKIKSTLAKLLKAICNLKLKNKIALGLVSIAIVSLSMVKAESMDNLNSNYSYIESFNMNVSKELSDEVGVDNVTSDNLEDIVITINPTLEGDEFAVYKATVNLTLKTSDIKVKKGEKSFKVSDVKIEVIDVSPDLTSEDMVMLPDDSIKKIAKESATLTKKLEKELKKQKQYIEELIKSEM